MNDRKDWSRFVSVHDEMFTPLAFTSAPCGNRPHNGTPFHASIQILLQQGERVVNHSISKGAWALHIVIPNLRIRQTAQDQRSLAVPSSNWRIHFIVSDPLFSHGIRWTTFPSRLILFAS